MREPSDSFFCDYSSSYQTLLSKAHTPSLYLARQKATITQVFKILNNIALPMTSDFFPIKPNIYNLRDKNKIALCKFNTIHFGKNSFRYRGAKLWNDLPLDIKGICYKYF